jgi:hypothetical protein
MSGAVPLLPLYVFMAWRGTPLPLVFLNFITVYSKINFFFYALLSVYFEHLDTVLLLPVVITVFALHYLQF